MNDEYKKIIKDAIGLKDESIKPEEFLLLQEELGLVMILSKLLLK